MVRRCLLVFWLLALGLSECSLAAEELITIPTREGVSQSYLLLHKRDAKPEKVVLLFPGGQGNMRLKLEGGEISYGYKGNFLVRARKHFFDQKTPVAVMDAPSDQQNGMEDNFRMGKAHAGDIAAVVKDMKMRFPGVKVYLIGTSRGTISAAYTGCALGGEISGMALTSSVFVAHFKSGNMGLSNFDLGAISTPILLVHHLNDGCNVSPYRAVEKFSNKYPLITVQGGKPSESDECDAKSPHGYFGKEEETVKAIKVWMNGDDFPRQVQ